MINQVLNMDVSTKGVVALIISFLGTVQAGDYCYGDDGFEYCSNGCCGDYHSPCCNEKVAAIVGGVIGGLLFISFLVVIICCCIRRRGRQGTVLTGNQSHMVVNTVQYPGAMYPSANAVSYPPQPMVAGAYPQQPMIAGAYPQQPMVAGAYPQQPPPYQPQQFTSPPGYQQNLQGYSNAGFASDTTGNQTTEKQEPTAPADY